MNNDLIPECYSETTLLHILGFPNVNHQLGKPLVASFLKKQFQNRFAIAIIDKDKAKKRRIPNYIKPAQTQKEENGLILQKIPNKQHYLIVVNPVFETWIWEAAKEVAVDPAQFKFDSFERFLQTKLEKIAQNQNFKNFLNTLKQKNSPRLQTLVSWITELRKTQ